MEREKRWRENDDGEEYIYKYLYYYYFIIDGGRQGGSAMPRLTSGDDDDDGEVDGVDDDDEDGNYFLVGCEKKKGWESHPPSNLILRRNIINWPRRSNWQREKRLLFANSPASPMENFYYQFPRDREIKNKPTQSRLFFNPILI